MSTTSPVLLKSELLDLKKSYIKNKEILPLDLKQHFPQIFSSLEDANGVSDYRVICCDSLAIWFLRLSQAIHQNHDLIEEFNTVLDNKTATFIFEYVIDFWNESGAPLGNSLKEMFTKMISFLNSTSDRLNLYQSWLEYVLNAIPLNLRVTYFMVEVLCNEIPGSSTLILTQYSSFIKSAVSYMWSNALANPVGKALQVVFKNYYKELAKDDSQWLHSWDKLIVENMQKDNLRKNIQNYLLPYLFKVSLTAYRSFVKELVDSNDETQLSIMLISLRIGHELGIVEETFEGTDKIVSIELLSDLMCSDEGFFRIESFSLLTTSPRGSKPISSEVLDLVLLKLDVFLTDVNLETRNEFAALFKKFILRLRDSTYAINRNAIKMIAKNKFLDEANECLAKVENTKSFLNKLLLQLIDNMRSGVSFQRCNLAMKILSILVRSGLDATVDRKYLEKLHMDYPFNIEIYKDPRILRVLIDNITNDFEEIRDLTVSILSMSPVAIKELSEDQLQLILDRSFIMLGDLKGRRADAGAKILQFIFANRGDDITIVKRIVEKLIQCTDLAKENFTTAVYEANIHGYYLALNCILMGSKTTNNVQYHGLLQQIISTIFDVWNLCQPVLTHDSPEGNLPDSMQKLLEPSKKHLETKFGPATQVILSYSWRSVKESTALLASILSTFNDDVLFDNSQYSLNDIGELIIDQLSTIRHPGAFSSVYPTFLLCCNRCFRLGLNELPENWLHKNLLLIEDKSHSITRRSGGLPYLQTAILTAEYTNFKTKKNKKQVPPLFPLTFEKLYEIAIQPFDDSTGEETLELPQVHALNSIRFLFVESKLSELSNHYIDRSLDLALGRFSSKHWSVRNASVMLFTTLQNRLFGTKKIDNHHLSTISARLFFSRYKRLQPILLKNFEVALKDEKEVENLFPILTILSRLHSTPGYNPVSEFKPLLLKSFQSKYWKVREMAARALPSIVNDDAFYSQIEELISLIRPNQNNEFHGILFAIKELLVRTQLRAGNEDDTVPPLILSKIYGLAEILLKGNYSCATTYVEILDIVLLENLNDDPETVALISKLGNCYIEHDSLTALNGGKQLFASRLLTLLLKSYTALKDLDNMVTLLKLGLFSTLYECQLSAIEYISENYELLTDIDRSSIIEILWIILESGLWSYVKAASLILLKTLLIANEYQEKDLSGKTEILLYFIDDPSEDVRSTALECLGPFVSKLNDVSVFSKWFRLIAINSNDDMSYHLRFASLKSCKSYIQAYLGPKDENYISTLIKLYQFLYDDDDEIREMVSFFISKDLMSMKLNMVAVEVEKRFAGYLRDNFDKDTLNKVIFHIYIKKLLELDVEIIEESSLFNVEKNNFYRNIIDELRFYITMLPEITELQRQTLREVIAPHNVKLQTLFQLKDDILGVFRNEDYFNYAYIVLLNYKTFKLGKAADIVHLNDDTHPLIRELVL